MRDRLCLITGTRPDGNLTWHAVDAKEPRGALPLELVPAGVDKGSEVRITAERDASGNWSVVECTLPRAERPRNSFLITGDLQPLPTTANTHLSLGQIRWTNVRNPLENSTNTGKYRPALLVSGNYRQWRIMGFTTKSQYEDGQARTPIPNHLAIGLYDPGFFWGCRLTRVDTIDIGSYIGNADHALLTSLLKLARSDLYMEEIAQVRQAMSALATAK